MVEMQNKHYYQDNFLNRKQWLLNMWYMKNIGKVKVHFGVYNLVCLILDVERPLPSLTYK